MAWRNSEFFGGNNSAPVSVISGGQDAWENRMNKYATNPQAFFEERLAHKHGCTHFLPPPVKAEKAETGYESKDVLLGVRFPSWLQCKECNELKEAHDWSKSSDDRSAGVLDVRGQAQKPKGICGSRAVYYYLRAWTYR